MDSYIPREGWDPVNQFTHHPYNVAHIILQNLDFSLFKSGLFPLLVLSVMSPIILYGLTEE
jgi:hypothetical protein